jgi:hypothetical protein
MSLSANKLIKQVDLPVWEWTRPLPVAPTAGLSSSCVADAPDFNPISGRYIYMLLNATNFWRYDTVSDTYMQMASPGITPLSATNMRFAGAAGYYGRTIAATSTTMDTGLPFGKQAIGYRIRIISGKGAGQERIITNVSDPIVADFGGATSTTTFSLTDTNKNWGVVGATNNVNNWIGYVIRVIGGTGFTQVRKILHNSATVISVADTNIYSHDTWSLPMSPTAGTPGWTSPGTGAIYNIEYSTITVDTAWDVTPDNTSRYVIQSGGIWLASGATVGNGTVTLQYYSVLEDIWYAKTSVNNIIPTNLTDLCIERLTENSTLWYTGLATSGSTTTLVDANASWTANQWSGYETTIWSGTGRGQIAVVANNTGNTLTFTTTLDTALDATSRYNITGYDGGIFTSTAGRIVSDSSKNWAVNRWTNYAVRIVSGTGVGQTRQILSNGSDSLVVYDCWNVQPDNTSKYIIQSNSQDMFLAIGGGQHTYMYRVGDTDMLSPARILDEGINAIACAMLTDGTSTATHEIYEQKPIAISAISGTTTITATTVHPHQLKVGQWVSIRGVTSAAADVYNVTGKVQITSVPSLTTFTYTPFAAGTGTYQYSNNIALGTTTLIDAAKYFADLATGGSTTTVTFSRATPSNINGWYVYGTNIADGAQIVSGAGTTTLTLNLTGAGTPSGTIIITKWPRPVTATYASGGGAGVFSVTLSAPIPTYVKGWLATGTNIGLSATVTGGEGTATPLFSIQCSGTPSGTITFSCPTNNLLPVTATYSSGSGTSITLSGNVPSYIRGWLVCCSNIANGTTVTGGEGTSTVTLSTPTAGTPSGTVIFYPPPIAPVLHYGTTGIPALSATGMVSTGQVFQMVAQNATNPTIMTSITASTTPTAGVSKYVLTRRYAFGHAYEGHNINYLDGIAFGTQSTTTLVDTNAFWATATGSGGSAGATSFTLSAPGSPIHNGWYVSGTGIPLGARVVSGAGTTSITIDLPLTGVVSGTITFTAWSQSLVNRRLRIFSGTGFNQDLVITGVTPATGTITFGAATAPGSGVSTYSILPFGATSTGLSLQWVSDSSTMTNKGRYLFRFYGGGNTLIDRYDITTDRVMQVRTTPSTETLSSGSMYAYDQLDRIYFTKDVTNRIYYLDVNTMTLYGSGMFPYVAGTAGIGNMMEIFKTADGLKYLWVNRKAQVETFRQLLFY